MNDKVHCCSFLLPLLAILYELLYERVFDTDVSKIVEELNPPEVNKDGSRNSDESGAEDENLE